MTLYYSTLLLFKHTQIYIYIYIYSKGQIQKWNRTYISIQLHCVVGYEYSSRVVMYQQYFQTENPRAKF